MQAAYNGHPPNKDSGKQSGNTQFQRKRGAMVQVGRVGAYASAIRAAAPSSAAPAATVAEEAPLTPPQPEIFT